MSSVFSRLDFTFDTSKFGDAQYLTPQAEAYLNAAPLEMPNWVKSDLANGTVQTATYYRNPVENVCTYLTSNATNLLTLANTDVVNVFISTGAADSANLVIANLQGLLIEITNFKSHTDNISGIAVESSNTDTIPNYDSATRVGNHLLSIVNSTDGVMNTTPMLGSMTSLFITDDLISNSIILLNDYNTLNNSFTGSGTSNISNTTLNTISQHIEYVNTLITLRRTEDWNFYNNAVTIVNDYMSLFKLNNVGGTQKYLIDNLIGSESYKEKLNS